MCSSDLFEVEISANIQALINLYNYLYEKKSNLLNREEFFENKMFNFLENRSNDSYFKIEQKFDELINNDMTPFNLEYDSTGNRLDINQIINNKINDNNLYENIIKNTVMKKQESKYNNEIIINSLKKELTKLLYQKEFFSRDSGPVCQ